jgi:transcriptional regulator with XRE-family HTH domain
MNTMAILKFIGEAIKTARKQKDLTQEYMALKLGYKDKSTYAKIERGELSRMDLFVLIEICELLDIDFYKLLKSSGISSMQLNY